MPTFTLPTSPTLGPDMTFTRSLFFGSTRRSCEEETFGIREPSSSLTLTAKVLSWLSRLSRTPSRPMNFVLVKQTTIPGSHSLLCPLHLSEAPLPSLPPALGAGLS